MAGFVVRKVQKLDAKDVKMLIESDKAVITDSSSAEWVNIIDRGGLLHVIHLPMHVTSYFWL